MDKNKRLYYIDLLKVIAVFLIINSHCEPVYRIKQLATGGALGNSLFFICSGFCLKEVIENKVSWLVNKIFKLKQKGINLIFPDVDKIEQLLIEELKSENK